jgi:hypothetical protein
MNETGRRIGGPPARVTRHSGYMRLCALKVQVELKALGVELWAPMRVKALSL